MRVPSDETESVSCPSASRQVAVHETRTKPSGPVPVQTWSSRRTTWREERTSTVTSRVVRPGSGEKATVPPLVAAEQAG